ncbi:hypothetical protein P4114_29555 [Pseudomonas aeruginosa]|nr:hypothetical protein [Pseudomonas aeruginosa]
MGTWSGTKPEAVAIDRLGGRVVASLVGVHPAATPLLLPGNGWPRNHRRDRLPTGLAGLRRALSRFRSRVAGHRDR